jgi:hypothetical protein
MQKLISYVILCQNLQMRSKHDHVSKIEDDDLKTLKEDVLEFQNPNL